MIDTLMYHTYIRVPSFVADTFDIAWQEELVALQLVIAGYVESSSIVPGT